jgi:hypothetical protein
MEKKPTTLESLQERIKLRKIELLKLCSSKFSKHYVSQTCDSIFDLINELKDVEKEQSRLDWKAGYNECVLDTGEAFGNDRLDCFPNDEEMKVIDEKSLDFINRKFK